MKPKATRSPKPPVWATRILQWYCRPELLEDLEGDLHEYFERNVQARGVKSARLIYILDVFKFFRIYTIRKPQFLNLLIQWIMIGSYIKTSGRSIVRNKLFAAINIAGLAVSMSVGLLVIAFLSDLFSYDDFHQRKAQIYQLNTLDERNGNPPMRLATSSLNAGKKIAQTITGVEQVTMLRRGFDGDATVGEKIIPFSGFFFVHVILTKFAYHQPIGTMELFTGLVVVMLLACFMIGSQTLRVAKSNPAAVLKAE